jgi:rhamnosyltransferase
MRTYAVIVTFNPDERLSQNVKSLLSQVDKVIIVDNCSGSKEVMQSFKSGVEIVYNSRNVGLASALNQGVRSALEAKAEWIITFDQDSIAPATFVADLLTAYEACPYKDQVALVGPVYRDQSSDHVQSFALETSTNLYAPMTHTMTSGNLVKASVFQRLGLFRDEFFIDYIDMEFCLRCLTNGCRLIEAREAILLHSVGERGKHTLLGTSFSTTHHSPSRYYYRTRNRVYIYKRYWRQQSRWVFKDVASFFVETAKMLLAEKQRWAKVKSISKGLWDGFSGHTLP